MSKTVYRHPFDRELPMGLVDAALRFPREVSLHATLRFASAWRWCGSAVERSRQRQALARLDDRLLRDIGISREQALAETSKPFWRR